MPSATDFLLRVKHRIRRTLKRAISRYSCPICRSGVSDFLPLPAMFSEERERQGNPYPFDAYETLNYRAYTCPVCFASDRDRLFALYLKRRLTSSTVAHVMHVLHIAPSIPIQEFLKRIPHLKVRTADLYREDVDDRLDICDMRIYERGKFDAFICSHVLEHVPDDRGALLELRRVLKTGGFGILMVPINLQLNRIDEDPSVTSVSERWRRFGQDDHIRQYCRAGFLERVMEAGFEVEELGIDWFGPTVFHRHGITPTSVLYVVGTGDGA